jgi:hypothetical protein
MQLHRQGRSSWRVKVQQFAKEVRRRLPLAEAVLLLWREICDPPILQDLFDRNRGACYERALSFPVLVNVVADSLLEHEGSGRKSFEQGRENGELNVSNVAAYGKLKRLPMLLSQGFLAETTSRLATVFPPCAATELPASLQEFTAVVLDGKAIKRVPKLLGPLRGASGGVLGGKALVALELSTGLALAMATSLDGDANDAGLVPDVVPQVQCRRSHILWVADRQFCDLTQPRAFTSRAGDHYVVRYHPRSKFCVDPDRPSSTGKDSQGRSYTEEWGWLGAARNKDRFYVRLITLRRVGEDPILLVTDLLDDAVYPATDLLQLYLMRWGIERVFQQITEVFHLQKLIATTPQGTLFQFAFCLVLYNMIQVIRAYVADGAERPVGTVSTELLFDDVRRQLITVHEMLTIEQVVSLVPPKMTPAELRRRLQQLLGPVWTDRWRKAPPKKRKPAVWKETKRTHCSAYRVLQQDRVARKTASGGRKRC